MNFHLYKKDQSDYNKMSIDELLDEFVTKILIVAYSFSGAKLAELDNAVGDGTAIREEIKRRCENA